MYTCLFHVLQELVAIAHAEVLLTCIFELKSAGPPPQICSIIAPTMSWHTYSLRVNNRNSHDRLKFKMYFWKSCNAFFDVFQCFIATHLRQNFTTPILSPVRRNSSQSVHTSSIHTWHSIDFKTTLHSP